MLQIQQSAIPSSNALPGAAAEAERAPGDGFESLLAGLMGLASQPALPTEPGRATATATLPTLDPDAVATPDAAATNAASGDGAGGGGGVAGGAGSDPEGSTTPLLRPAATPLEPGAAPGSPATPRGSTPSTALPPGTDSAATLPRPPGERPGNAASPEAPRPSAERPGSTASTELPRPPVERPGSAASAGVLRPSAERPGNAVAPGSPTSPAERPAAPARAEAGKPAAAEAVPSVRRAEARAEAAVRPVLDAAARGSALANRTGMPGQVLPGQVLPNQMLLGPNLLGSGLTGAGFAQLTLHAEWQEPLDLDAGRSLTSLPGGAHRLDAIAAEAAAGRTVATPPAQQLAAAIGRAVGGDVQRLTVQLSPEALGSIEIALEVDAERRLAVVIMAERPETVELLRTEARDLQRLLAAQGIDLGDAGLELGLMGGEGRERQSNSKEDNTFEAELEAAEVQGPAAPLQGATPPEHDPVGRTARLNLSI